MAPKILVAMSGGVDSSVSAYLLKEKGFDVIGATMQIWPSKKDFGGCCGLSAINDAKEVAQKIGIPHYVLNFRELFLDFVIKDFTQEYKNGRTPNPCVRCNEFIKFKFLLKKAEELGAHFLATGHYAEIENENGKYFLLKGKDPKKDQSYFLYRMDQSALQKTVFPVGSTTKKEVREIASKLGLSIAEKKDSQEICFIENNNYGEFLKEFIPNSLKPGNIVDKNGSVMGKHDGVAFYTIGQRKGIGAHKGVPKYVIEIDPEKNLIVIGDEEDIYGRELTAKDLSFTSGEKPYEMEITAKIRYNSEESRAKLIPLTDDRARVVFAEPQRAITPGQSVVFYSGNKVLGGGIIDRGGL